MQMLEKRPKVNSFDLFGGMHVCVCVVRLGSGNGVHEMCIKYDTKIYFYCFLVILPLHSNVAIVCCLAYRWPVIKCIFL